MTETMQVSETGGIKATKPARHDLLDVGFLHELALHAGIGAVKYEVDNWRRGYPLSSSFAAAKRHMDLFWAGESTDPEMGTSHLVAAAFHMMVLTVNSDNIAAGVLPAVFDDRPPARDLGACTDSVLAQSSVWAGRDDVGSVPVGNITFSTEVGASA